MLSNDRLDRLRLCHQQMASVIRPSIEPFEIVAKVEEFRRYWRPEETKVILLAESHVYTTSSDLRSQMKLDGYFLDGYPVEFVKFVYCLGYGEAELLDRRPENNAGTWQYWKILYSCANWVESNTDFRPILMGGESDLRRRIGNKIRLLETLRKMGVWLVDASVCGLYPKPEESQVVERAPRVSWDEYVGAVVKDSAALHVICIGVGVYEAIGESLHEIMGDEVTVFFQPQKRGQSSADLLRMHQRYYEICKKYCG